MKTLRTYLLILFSIFGFGSLLLSCGNWEVPTKKTQRECVKPSGTLNNVISQRKADFSISNSGGTTDKVTWDFGDNNSAVTTGMTVSYTYPSNGTYTVKATMANTCGQETTIQQTITVSDAVNPTVTIQAISGVSTTTALAGMTITSNGNATITQYGLCYSTTNQAPNKDSDPILLGALPAPLGTSTPLSLTSLQPNTIYYVRSFATNAANKTSYSTTVQTFQTGQDPIVITNGTASVGYATASINLIVQHLGNPVAKEYGIYYSSTTNNPDVNSTSAKASGPVVGVNIVLNLNDLTASKTYYYRAFARTASDQIIYGPIMSFTTQADPVAQDLIASIAFTDQSLVDVSGYNNHVKLVDNPTFTTDHNGKPNSAIFLDGVNDYFYMSENSSLNPEALSVSVWFKMSSFTHRMQIYNKSRFSDSAFETYSALLKLENDQGPNTVVMTNIKQNSACQPGKGWLDFPFTSRIEVNTWYHLVFTYSGKTVRMYLNNVPLYTNTDLPYSTMDKCPGADLKFGAAIQGLNWFFHGAMDDIRIYKRALTASEVDILYKQ
ncbi:LamG-like jellyroll fold domain-containing protein [Spirosoma lituiforme]